MTTFDYFILLALGFSLGYLFGRKDRHRNK
jgi:hypothetical protein